MSLGNWCLQIKNMCPLPIAKLSRYCWGLTFVEAFFTVHDGDAEPFETGGPMELTMVLVQLPIWPTHGFIMWFALVQALTLPLTSLMVDHTVLTQTTILVFTRTRKATVSHKSCKTTNYLFFLSKMKANTFLHRPQRQDKISLILQERTSKPFKLTSK